MSMYAESSAPCELAEIVYEKPLSGVYDEVPFGASASNTLWVKFSDRDGIDEWIGIFGTGTSCSARVDKAIEPDKFLISAGGFGYLVDATKRQLLNHHAEPSSALEEARKLAPAEGQVCNRQGREDDRGCSSRISNASAEARHKSTDWRGSAEIRHSAVDRRRSGQSEIAGGPKEVAGGISGKEGGICA